LTIPTSYFTVGNKFRVIALGAYTTPSGNTATSTWALTLGGIGIGSVTTGALMASASNLPLWLEEDCTVQTVGASGTVQCNGGLYVASALTGQAPVYYDMSGFVTVNTTANLTIAATGLWSSVAGSQTANINQASVTVA